MNTNIPQFGKPLEPCTERPGAYAVIFNETGQLLVVTAKNRYHLPGGGIDAGEDPKTAVVREVMEETGYSMIITRELGQAHQFLDTADLGPINKLGMYFLGTVSQDAQLNQSTDHEHTWISTEDFFNSSAHDFHKWAVREALKIKTN